MIHTDTKDVVTRAEALCRAFGWQGGTIHQLAAETGCDALGLIYTPAQETSQDHRAGWFAYRTNSLDYNQKFLMPGVKGRLQFWLGVAAGVQSSLKQDMATPKKF